MGLQSLVKSDLVNPVPGKPALEETEYTLLKPVTAGS